jgi:hypothetical protein
MYLCPRKKSKKDANDSGKQILVVALAVFQL